MANPENRQLAAFPNIVLRDAELFHTKIGLGVYSPQLEEKYKKYHPEGGRADRAIWLQAETEQLQRQVDEGKSVLIQGDLGAGKSALLYGLRSIARAEGHPYYNIDGHFIGTPDHIIAKLNKAHRRDVPAFWDSFDYLRGTTRKIIKSGKRIEFAERSQQLLLATLQYVEQGGQLIATTHTESWMKRYGMISPDQDEDIKTVLTDNKILWDTIISQMNVHKVRGVFTTKDEVRTFYEAAQLPETAIGRLLELKDTPRLQQFVASGFDNSHVRASAQELEELLQAPTIYKYAKLIALDRRRDAEGLRSALADNNISTGNLLQEYVEFIIGKRRETLNRTVGQK